MTTASLKNDIKYCKVVGTLFKRLESEGWSERQKLSENAHNLFFSIFSLINPLVLFMILIKHKPNQYQSEKSYSMMKIFFDLRGYGSNKFDYNSCSELFSIYGFKKEVLGGLITNNDSLFDKPTLKSALPDKDILWYTMNSSMATELLYSLYKKITKISYEEYHKVYDMLSLTNPLYRGHKVYSLAQLLPLIDKYNLKEEIKLWERMKYKKGYTSELRGKILSRMAEHFFNKSSLDYSIITKFLFKDGTSEAYKQVYHKVRSYFNIDIEYIDSKKYMTINKNLAKFLKIKTELDKVYEKLSKKRKYLPQLTYHSIKVKG